MTMRTDSRAAHGRLLGILLLAAAVRSVGLSRGLWLDEIANVGVLTRPAVQALFNVEITTARAPFFFVLYRPWLAMAGDSAVAARWPALLGGVLSVALLWRLARTWAGPRVGDGAALLLALNPLHIWYSQEASFYTFVTALALWVVWQSTTLAPDASHRRLGRQHVLWALGLALLLASSPWTLFLSAALGAWVFIWQRAHSRIYLIVLGLALLLSAPALVVYLRGVMAGWSTPVTRPGLPLPQMIYSLLTLAWGFAVGPAPEALRQALANGVGLGTLARQNLGWLVLGASGLALLLFTAGKRLLFPRRAPGPAFSRGGLVLLWLSVPLLGANLLTWWAQTNFNVRYVLFALPALLVGMAALDRRLVNVAVALSVLFWLRGVTDPAFAQENLQLPAQFLQAAVQPTDVVLLQAPEVYLLAPLAFYGAPAGALAWYNGDTARSQSPAAFARQNTAGHCRIWLWSARAWLIDREGALAAALAASTTPVTTWRWPGSELTLYQRAPCP